jgi:hypothetical protein
MIKRLALIVASLIFTLLLIDAFLRYIDPWNVVRFASELAPLAESYVKDDLRGYILPPGKYDLGSWSATITDQKTRLVPDTNTQAQCTITIVGDSVAFGHGVNDQDTWVNVLARQMPTVHLLNTGIDSYNIENIENTILAFPNVDGYLYALVDNDNVVQMPIGQKRTNASAIELYWRIITIPPLPTMNEHDFYAALDRILANDRLSVFTFDMGNLSRTVAQKYPQIPLLPLWSENNSKVDWHANVKGNREIAEHVLPILKQEVAHVCPNVDR